MKYEKDYGTIKNISIGPRITFSFQILEERCKEVALQEQLKKNAYVFCKTSIYTPQAYGHYNTKKKNLRKSTKYKKGFKKDTS